MRLLTLAVLFGIVLMLGGCIDEGRVPSLVYVDAPLIPKLRVFHVEAPDAPSTYMSHVAEIDALVKATQTFFADEMERHGYGRKTFVIDTNVLGQTRIENVIATHDLQDYVDANDYDEIIAEMIDRFGPVWDIHQFQEIRLFFIDFFGHSCGGRGLNRGNGNGEAFLCKGFDKAVNGRRHHKRNQWTVEIIAHELGHVFGLGHNWTDGEDIMSYGDTQLPNGEIIYPDNPMSKITAEAAALFNRHPAFQGF